MKIKIGMKAGNVVVLSRFRRDFFNGGLYVCLCDCGDPTLCYGDDIKNGNIEKLSCGCRIDVDPHDVVMDKIMRQAWKSMINRCHNPKNPNYKHYGKRGIEVCERWLNSFADFWNDMQSRPGSEYSIDRVDNNGNYEPDNCRWATPTEQNNNRRR